MNSVSNWNDFKPFGIYFLTAEACGLSLRILFDISPKGKAILEQYLGVKNIELWEPMNPKSRLKEEEIENNVPVNEQMHPIGTFMLTRDMFTTLAVFCLLTLPENEVVVSGKYGVNAYSRENYMKMREHIGRLSESRIYMKEGDALGGFRNRHQFSGRVV